MRLKNKNVSISIKKEKMISVPQVCGIQRAFLFNSCHFCCCSSSYYLFAPLFGSHVRVCTCVIVFANAGVGVSLFLNASVCPYRSVKVIK